MSRHGGGREGAGGPKGPRPKTATGVIQIRVSPHEKQCIEDRAARRGMSVTEFIKDGTLTGRDDNGWVKIADCFPDLVKHRRVMIYTEGTDFDGEQFFDVMTDSLVREDYEDPNDQPEVSAYATHWKPLQYPFKEEK